MYGEIISITKSVLAYNQFSDLVCNQLYVGCYNLGDVIKGRHYFGLRTSNQPVLLLGFIVKQ